VHDGAVVPAAAVKLPLRMGIGEAAVTILSETGVPTPVVHTRITPPASRMGPADDVEGTAKASPLWAKYGQRVDNESAREMLAARMAPPPEAEEKAAAPAGNGAGKHAPAPAAKHKEAAGAMAGGVAAVTSFLQSKEGKQLQKEVMRGVFGLLKKRM
jgi:hypothetical protein